MTAREAATAAVGRVLRGGAWANHATRATAAGLPDRERAAAQALVFGTLRRLLRVERALAAVSSRPLARIQPRVLDVLRVGGYELLFTPAPAYAVVDEAVRHVGATTGEPAAGFVNAVLRALADTGEPPLPPGPAGAALVAGVEDWLYRAVERDLGAVEAEAFFAASLEPAAVAVRHRRGPLPPLATPVAGIAGAHTLAPGTDPAGLAEVERGDLVLMDPASVAVAAAVGAAGAALVYDAAAAPGGKTLALWDALGDGGLLVAGDRHRRRLARARRRLRRLGAIPAWVVADAARPPLAASSCSRVLVDAPCTGLGTLRRRPEIRHRVTPAEVERLARLQRRMLQAALTVAAPGARVVYSVCTVLTAETVDVVAGLGARPPEGLPGQRLGDGLLLAPHTTGTDGMFVAVIE